MAKDKKNEKYMAKKKQKKGGQQGQQFLSPDEYLRQRARTLAIGKCYVSEDIERAGEGHVIVSRRHTGGRVSVAFYLVDIWCVGVKDSYYRLRMEDYEFEEMMEDYKLGIRECSYDEAHNRIYGAIAFAEEASIAPDKSFNVTKYMLEEDTDDIPLIEYEYGHNGKHTLITRSNLEASHYLPLLKKNLGEGNYEYILKAGPDLDDEEDWDDEGKEEGAKPWKPQRMADLVRKTNKDLLIHYASLLGFDIDKSLNDDEVRREYVSIILDNPLLVLYCLPYKDLSVLEQMRDDPTQRHGVFVIYDHRNYMMELLGMAKCHINPFGYYQVYVAEDFADAVLPLLAESFENPLNRLRLTAEAFIEGLANLYGEVNIDDAKAQMKAHFEDAKESYVNEMFDIAYENSLMLKMSTRKDNGRRYVMSPYAWGDEDAQRQEITRQSEGIESRRQFTYDEITKAGGVPVPAIPNKHSKEFETYLTDRLCLRESQVQDACFSIWFDLMHEKEILPGIGTETAEDFFEDCVLGQAEVTLNPQLCAEGRQLLKAYIDSMPRWTLKGHAAEEVE